MSTIILVCRKPFLTSLFSRRKTMRLAYSSIVLGAFAQLLSAVAYVSNFQCKNMIGITTSETAEVPLNRESFPFILELDTIEFMCCDFIRSWFYFKIDSPGRLEVDISFPWLEDIELVVWGPFDTVDEAVSSCTEGLTSENEIDRTCKTGIDNPKRMVIPNGVQGTIYVLVIGNCKLSSSIQFKKFGGNATTTCDVVTDYRGWGYNCGSDTPFYQPSSFPTLNPSSEPSSIPSVAPSIEPSHIPSTAPSIAPSVSSLQPSSLPSNNPSFVPSWHPSIGPSIEPSTRPSYSPSTKPSNIPSDRPSTEPSIIQSDSPTRDPSRMPSIIPSLVSSLSSFHPSDTTTFESGTIPSAAHSLVLFGLTTYFMAFFSLVSLLI